jgi:hypothetical protein
LGPYWVESGNLISDLCVSLRLTLFPGYDRIIEQRIHYMLDNSTSFRKQIADLSTSGVEIEIEPEMSYHSWAISLASRSTRSLIVLLAFQR